MFKVDYNEVKETNGIIAEGYYEVVVTKAEINNTKEGKEFIDMWLTVRNDVDQQYKNVNVFNKLWKGRDTGNYQMWQIQTISKACELENGKNYANLEEWLKDLYNKTMRIKVSHQDYNGEPQAVVKGYQETKFKDLRHINTKKEESQIPQSFVAIDDDDIPF